MHAAHSGLPARRSLPIKYFLPLFLLLAGLSQKGRQRAGTHQGVVHPVKGLPQGSHKIDKQHDTVTIRVIPDLVIEGVVKQESPSLRPVPDIIADADPAPFTRLRHEESEMIAQDAIVGPAMGWNVFVR